MATNDQIDNTYSNINDDSLDDFIIRPRRVHLINQTQPMGRAYIDNNEIERLIGSWCKETNNVYSIENVTDLRKIAEYVDCNYDGTEARNVFEKCFDVKQYLNISFESPEIENGFTISKTAYENLYSLSTLKIDEYTNSKICINDNVINSNVFVLNYRSYDGKEFIILSPSSDAEEQLLSGFGIFDFRESLCEKRLVFRRITNNNSTNK